jgi:hypothetical protein
LVRVYVSLKKIAVLKRFNGTINVDIVSKYEVSRVSNYIPYVVHKGIEEQGPQEQ